MQCRKLKLVRTAVKILIIITVFINLDRANAQINDTIIGVNPVVNNYLKVDSVYSDRVKISAGYNASDFNRGDLVILMQMNGIRINVLDTIDYPDPFPDMIDYKFDSTSYTSVEYELRNTGTYEALSVDNIVGNTIIFTAELNGAYTSGEAIQLIKVFEHQENIIVNANIQGKPWDGETGGVIALFTLENLVLNANIDASGLGFQGALPEDGYTSDINTDNVDYYSYNQPDKAALKGEGGMSKLQDNIYLRRRGIGHWGLGGGGGQGKYAGGGGGGHAGGGGIAGGQRGLLSVEDTTRAQGGGGIAFRNQYNVRAGEFVLMGGGGGTSTQNLLLGDTATRGGNGGGIVIILADSIIGNGASIRSTGESVNQLATAGAGGGGGGGSVFLDVNGVSGPLNIQVQGGRGGSIKNTCPNPGGGAGGGGGYGVVGFSLPGNQYYYQTDIDALFMEAVGPGSNENDPDACIYNAFNASASGGDVDCDEDVYRGYQGEYIASVICGIEIPLNGYYFNAVAGSDTICKNQIPGPLTGSVPKGGDGNFTYVWQKSIDLVNWDSISAPADSLLYQPPRLDTTTYYRRYVTASNGSSDTSKVIQIFVHELIKVEDFIADDTICQGSKNLEIIALNATAGGNNIYQYTWQYSNDLVNWTNDNTDTLTNASFQPRPLFDTTYIRRIVTSNEVCADTSLIKTITVLPIIENNMLIGDTTQVLCQGAVGDTMFLTAPSGGDPAYYEYEWLLSPDNKNWTSIIGADTTFYFPGVMFDSVYYKRIVKSGIGLACKDTSAVHNKIVLQSIANNLIDTFRHICAGTVPDTLQGETPWYGAHSYSYQWQIKMAGAWNNLPADTLRFYATTIKFSDSTYLRRIVYSGLDNACADTSETAVIEVIPYIQNNIDNTPDSLCYNQIPQPFIGETATGGDNNFVYHWQYKTQGNVFTNISNANDTAYQSPALTESTSFRRQVISDNGNCEQVSDTIEITVFNEVVNNSVLNGLIDSTCYATSINLLAKQPNGGMPGDMRYLWLQSHNNNIYEPAEGSNKGQNYTSQVLTDSVYYKRVFYSGLSNECIDTSLATLVRINPLPYGDIAATVDSLCRGDNSLINWNINGNGPFTLNVDSGNGILEISNASNIDNNIFTPSQSLVLKLSDVIDRYGCYANDTNFSNTHEIVFFEIPEANAGADKEFCGLTFSLSGTLNADTGYWTSNFISFTGSESTSPGLSKTADSYGTGQVIWNERNGVCYDSDTMKLTLYEQPEQPVLENDKRLSDILSVDLFAQQPPNAGQGIWRIHKGSGEIADSLYYSTQITNLAREKWNVISWTIINGVCEVVSDTIQIFVSTKILPKGFSPNNDGINDNYQIQSSRGDVRIVIFNRWGSLVFEQNEYVPSISWDGTNLTGLRLPAGTYFYQAFIRDAADGTEVPFTGYIELRK